MEKKVAVVTGANKGIGYAIAEQLADSGAVVYVGARDQIRGQAAISALQMPHRDVRLLVIDVTDGASVIAAADTVAEQAGRVDILVNNAGLAFGFSTPPTQEPIEDVLKIYDVNVFGPIRVTQAFAPLLRKSSSANVVMMSSLTGSLTAGQNPESPFYRVNQLGYNSSKTAVNAIVVAFAKELADSGITVNAVEPGFVGTDMNNRRGVLTPDEGAAEAVRLALADAEDRSTGAFFGAEGRHPW